MAPLQERGKFWLNAFTGTVVLMAVSNGMAETLSHPFTAFGASLLMTPLIALLYWPLLWFAAMACLPWMEPATEHYRANKVNELTDQIAPVPHSLVRRAWGKRQDYEVIQDPYARDADARRESGS